ncbi:type II toxin-antitoxin system PemK/MazF family toxin [Leucobacter albus]|uniref:Type II toxin-antitoxin system PemK/MazF family toxin n=1 Tax=Leucobacter albus TaxID=272210 RepID=A0ABW3TJP3_9MICO
MANSNLWYQVGVALRKLLGLDGRAGGSGQSASRGGSPRPGAQPALKQSPAPKPSPTSPERQGARPGGRGSRGADYAESPGQFGAGATRDVQASELRGATLEYSPNMDGDPDPGEIVWTWVPYVENDGRGKDRPVLIIGRIDATAVFGCYVSTKYHRDFISIGSGPWDSQGRESFVSPERILRVTHAGMRREGATVARERFSTAVRGVLKHHGLN